MRPAGSRPEYQVQGRKRGQGVEWYEWKVGRGRERFALCNLFPRGECRDCPFLTCNNHPQFPQVQKHVNDLLRAGKKPASSGS